MKHLKSIVREYKVIIFLNIAIGLAVCSSSKNVSKRSPKRLAPWST